MAVDAGDNPTQEPLQKSDRVAGFLGVALMTAGVIVLAVPGGCTVFNIYVWGHLGGDGTKFSLDGDFVAIFLVIGVPIIVLSIILIWTGRNRKRARRRKVYNTAGKLLLAFGFLLVGLGGPTAVVSWLALLDHIPSSGYILWNGFIINPFLLPIYSSLAVFLGGILLVAVEGRQADKVKKDEKGEK